MQHLSLSIRPSRTEVLPDESFDVDVTLTNRNSVAIDVPASGAPCPFQFVLRSTTGDQVIHVLDVRTAFEARYGDPPPRRPPDMVPVEPRASVAYTYDFAEFYRSAVPPGTYELSVRYRKDSDLIESAGAPLKIVPPDASALVTVYGPSMGNLALVFTRREADGSLALYQRESFPDRPDCGIVCKGVTIGAGRSVTGVADAVELHDNRGMRWFAWLDGDSLGAGLAQYRTLLANIGPVPLGLKSAMLHDRGWQHSSESATFVVLGMNQQNHVAFAAAPFPECEANGVKPVDLSLSTLPVRWAVRFGAQEEKMQFDVVLGEGISGMTRLICRTIKPDAGEAGAPVVLTERALPLAALAMEPVAGKERGTVDALFGPTGDDARLTYLRLPLDGKPAVGEWTLTAPKDPEGKMSPSDWTITPGLKGVPVVLARFGDRLMIHRLSEGSQWGTLAENAAQARHLRLEVLRIGALWAIWDDPAYGIQYRRLSP